MSLLALAHWHDPAARAALTKAQAYVLGIQRLEKTGAAPADKDYGSLPTTRARALPPIGTKLRLCRSSALAAARADA